MTTTLDLAGAFSGGGNKSFYQLGLLRRWRTRLLERVAAVAACSAVACVAALYLSGREGEPLIWLIRRRLEGDCGWREEFIQMSRASIYFRGAAADVSCYQATCRRQMVEIAHQKVGATHKG